ncbi:lipoprotein [Spiroplasma eriocheiris]|uniref:Lipoprotein n=1 Tax=Spiroplasma eriocheiris TaxID=315358 RepID=A0A0H3XI64_9MOLU|nr:lipoprotein [Spiroplasma eriocheiris]AHF58099.1 hypothetical protein SPE_0981 [Spiroplasma eriocheiris CCTCC M 207170]AKM54538.1 hypothetical protein SERIO_v1c09800 [Spiroplasma eriocheiris]
MKKILAVITAISLVATPSFYLVSCHPGTQSFLPSEDNSLTPDINQFLTGYHLTEIAEGDYLAHHTTGDDSIFSMFNGTNEFHTLSPTINFQYDNSSKVDSFDINSNVLFKIYLAPTKDKLPSLQSIASFMQLFPMLKNSTNYTYSSGQVTIPQINLAGETSTITLYYTTINLNSDDFWNWEINKDLNNYFVNILETQKYLKIKQNSTNDDVLKTWLSDVYNNPGALEPVHLSNIKTIKNIDDFFQYLVRGKLTLTFSNLFTSIPSYSDVMETVFTNKIGEFKWTLRAKYLIV